MKAVVCKAWGPPESLVIEDRPPLEAEPGKVVVSVKAASVKFSDTLVIQNKYQTKPELPFIPGSEVTGVLKSIGAGVEGWKVGDRVSAQTAYGGYAEEVSAEPGRLAAIPESDAHKEPGGGGGGGGGGGDYIERRSGGAGA